MPFLDRSDLAKIDIEGAEWAILGDSRFARSLRRASCSSSIRTSSPGADPRSAALRLLGGAGTSVASALDLGPGHGLLWALAARTPQTSPGAERSLASAPGTTS